MKNRKPAKPRMRVDTPHAENLPWNHTSEGVLRRALEENDKQPYRELVLVALRGSGQPELFLFGKDGLRHVGLLEWAVQVMVERMRGRDRQD